ncbi:formate/nitrite transporter [Enterococcus canis]|jgi:Formate/nitrite family of transporters|uniref:Formate/nitrite transporter n=1 Tax=Enterococcus canis TaxID=214095 RepID=A0A1L8RGA9_9ENTE|nr:formate/nitrite transporter family protein [Enterococcus canis]OJG18777.1 formate/nitrite transporter [Enterococcus canis]
MKAVSPLLEKIDNSIDKKVDLFYTSPVRYMVRAVFACLFLTLGTAVAFSIAMKGEDMVHGLGKILYSFMFSWSLVMIIYMNAELGTSNMMYMTIGVFRKKVSVSLGLKILFTCILFNLIGGVFFAFLVSKTLPFQDLPVDSYLFTGVASKLEKSSLQIFVEAIFANIVVNTAVVASMRMKDDAGKVWSIIFIIFIFAFLGFEHVIANFPAFSLAYFASGGTLAAMTAGNVAHNLILALLGNFVGGGLVIGLGYAWLNAADTTYLD